MSKIKVKKNPGPPPMPNLNGFPTRERLAHMPEGMTHGVEYPRIGPSMVNAPMRPKNAPTQASAGSLESNLDAHEQHMLTRFLAAALTVHGRAKVSSYDGGSLSKGSKAEGELPFTDDEHQMITWHNQVMNNLQHRTKCGLQLLYKIYLGESNGVTLDDIGRAMTREDDKKIIKGGYITFFRMAVQDIEDAEKKIVHIEAMRKVISKTINAN